MVFYDKKPPQILVDLINESNPDLGIGLRQLENTRLTVPKPYPTVRKDGVKRVIKAFTNTGYHEWSPPEGVDHVDILVVAGGGGGVSNGRDTGAGGAGGLVFIPNFKVGGIYHFRVGAGGLAGENGESSTFGDIFAIGGGSGAVDDTDGSVGGSGGGAGRSSGNGGRGSQPFRFGISGIYGFGNAGGSNRGHSGTEGMGGGGAGESAVDAINIVAADRRGGDGLCKVTPEMGPYDKTYRFIDVFGDEYGELIDNDIWFAGGGGGGGEQGDPSQNVGGKGGGGRGGHLHNSVSRNGAHGINGTGGGGGGADNSTAGRGGSGIVLIAYNNPITNQEGYKYDHINTVIDVYPKPGQPVRGKATFYYRRLDLGSIFKNKVVRFDRWRESNTATIEDICGWLNEEYGTEFIPEDFPAQTFSPSAAIRTINVVPESYAYIGTLRFIWNPGKRDLDQIFESYDIDGMVWDLRHGNEADERPLMTFTGYGGDYTEFNDIIGSISNGSTLNADSVPIGLIIERFNQMYGTELSLEIPHTEPNGLSGLTVTRHSLPAAIIAEANSERFANVIAITSREDSWFGGRILFHHNLR